MASAVIVQICSPLDNVGHSLAPLADSYKDVLTHDKFSHHYE